MTRALEPRSARVPRLEHPGIYIYESHGFIHFKAQHEERKAVLDDIRIRYGAYPDLTKATGSPASTPSTASTCTESCNRAHQVHGLLEEEAPEQSQLAALQLE